MTELIPEPQGNPGGLESYASQLSSAAGRVEGLASRTISASADIKSGANWTGDAADGFSGFATNLAHSVGGTESHLNRIASAVRDYAAHLRIAKEKVQAYNKAAEAASCLAGKKRHAAIAALAGIRNEAEAAVKAAKAAGDQAASEIGDSSDGVLMSAVELGEKGSSAVDQYGEPFKKLAGYAADHGKDTVEDADQLNEDLPGLLEESRAEDPQGTARLEGIIRDWNTARRSQGIKIMSAGSKTLSVLNLASAPVAIPEGVEGALHPEDKGVAGDVDRGVSGAQAASSATDTVTSILNLTRETPVDDVPYVGEVALGANVIWNGENWLYKNSTVGHNVIYAVGSSEIDAGKWSWNAAKNVGNWAKGAPSTVSHEAGKVGGTLLNDGKGLVSGIHIHVHFP